MKKTLFVLFSIFLSIGVFAQDGVKWETGSLQDALNKAAANKKGPSVVFLDCYTSWCGPCKMMAEKVFPQKAAGDYFNARFVNIKIDMEKGDGPTIARKYAVNAYPTFLILDSKGNELGRVVGGAQLEKFIKMVEEAMDPAKQPGAILEKYRQSGEMKDAYAYMKALEEAYKEDEIVKFVAENYDKFGVKDKYSDKMWGYLVKSISLSNPKIMNKIVADKLAYDSAFGEDKVNEVLCNAIENELFGYLVGKKDIPADNLNRGCELYILLSEGLDEMDVLRLKLVAAKSSNNHEEFVRLLDGRFIGYTINAGQMRGIQRMLFNNPDIPDVEKARFVKEYKEFLQRNIIELEKLGEQYKDIEVPQRKMTGAMPMIKMN